MATAVWVNCPVSPVSAERGLNQLGEQGMRSLARLMAVGLVIALLPSLGWSQSTDRSEMDQWVKDTANQGDLPVGTKITTANWQQYKNFLPLGMQKLFEGKYFWKMPEGVELD